jgi:gluconokinase
VGWHQEARAALAGLSAQTDLAAFFRGAVEGVAFAYRRVLEQIVEVSGPVPRVVATGGISQSLPGWLNVAAGALNLPVTPVPIKRSTLRGTALRALDVVAPEVERRNPPLGAVLEPDERWVGEYQSRYERWLQLYAGTIS